MFNSYISLVQQQRYMWKENVFFFFFLEGKTDTCAFKCTWEEKQVSMCIKLEMVPQEGCVLGFL